jgi:hypothetical protein
MLSNTSGCLFVGVTNRMAADVLGMAFIPYYNHIMKLLETDRSLKRTIQGLNKNCICRYDYDCMLCALSVYLLITKVIRRGLLEPGTFK